MATAPPAQQPLLETRSAPPERDALFVEVALPLPVDQTFTYAVPASLRERTEPGMRALVPVKKRVATGYIVEVHGTKPEAFEARPLIDLPDEGPVLSAHMLHLCRNIATYYCCSWGEALESALPAGLRLSQKLRYFLQPEAIANGRFTDRQKAVIAALHAKPGLTRPQLAKAAGATALSQTLQALVRRGVIMAEDEGVREQAPVQMASWVRLEKGALLSQEDREALQRRAPKQAAIYLDLINGSSERAATDLYTKHGANAAILKALEAKGLIVRFEKELYRAPDMAEAPGAATPHALNDEQRAAFDAITKAMDAGEYAPFLLRGVTGSGKTEVYLQCIEHALKLGKDAIILVPEISLTPQTVGRFKARFKEQIAVLHSGLGTGERYDEWRRALRGEVRIVVGARSAIFAPLANLGIIVVDEEHDGSYKQGEVPRYHARDTALMRARLCSAACVLGSATPSLESYHNAARGKFTRLDLITRATNAPMPEVRLIDMREESIAIGGQIILSRTLMEAVQQRLDAREQVILLLNRRGFSPYVICPKCGWVDECDDCLISMTYHASGGVMRCHYCNAAHEPPSACTECGSTSLLFLGTGTQKVEEFLLRSFEGASIQRMDADTTAGKGGHARILGRFASGEIDILVGTQMIAKGHDYPGVTLVGVINGDTGLNVPDFRAAENSFQLLTQVAGRAGRGGKAGEVLIQTYRPRHYALQLATQHDYLGFCERELEERLRCGYPPYRRLANLMVESEDPDDAERYILRAERMTREAARELGFTGFGFMGPAPASVKRVRKKYRWNFGILSQSSKRLNATVRAVRQQWEQRPPKGVTLKIDLDPYNTY